MTELLADPNLWASLLTLTALEIVLGIDNIIFISILVGRLPKAVQQRARTIGLALAMVTRILLLLSITWVMGLSADLFAVGSIGISGRDVILIGGGLFLIAKATHEIHAELERRETDGGQNVAAQSFTLVVAQLVVVDLVFSLDSIITAIGMASDIEIMIGAVVIAMAVMYVASGPVSAFIAAHPTTKMLALAFLVLIGVALVAEGFDFHFPRGYIYFAMGFAAAVEAFNVMASRKRRRT